MSWIAEVTITMLYLIAIYAIFVISVTITIELFAYIYKIYIKCKNKEYCKIENKVVPVEKEIELTKIIIKEFTNQNKYFKCSVCDNENKKLQQDFFVSDTNSNNIIVCGHHMCKKCYPKVNDKKCPICRRSFIIT